MVLDTIGSGTDRHPGVVLRPPRLTDGPAWRRVRLTDEARLAPSFGDGEHAWHEQSTLTAWADRLHAMRAARRDGVMVPYVYSTPDGRFLGECLFSIDARSGLAELSLWAARGVPHDATTAATARGVLRMLEQPPAVPWVVAPVAAGNPGPGRLLSEIGFEAGATTARRLRIYRGEPTDHVVWRLGNTERGRAHLRELIDRYEAQSSEDWRAAG